MLFGKRHEQDLKEYLSKEALLKLLLRGKSIEEVTFKNFIIDQKAATKSIRTLEFILFLVAAGLFLVPFVYAMNGNFLGSKSLLFILSGLFPLSAIYLLSNVRKEKTLRSYSSSVKDREIFDRLLTYWEALRMSNYPILAKKTQGIIDIGTIYSADAGALILLGNSTDDWNAIRRTLVPNCPLLFPSPSALGLNFAEQYSESTEKHQSKTTSVNSEESIRLELDRLKLKIRNSADLRELLATGNVDLFNAIATITQLKAANHSAAKEDVVLRVIKCIEHSIENNRRTWPDGFSFKSPDGRNLNVSETLYQKICSGSSYINKWLTWTELI